MLCDEPGTGKSAPLAQAAEGRTLILAPAAVLSGGVWDQQLADWAPDLEATQVAYTFLSGRQTTEPRKPGGRRGSSPTGYAREEFDREWDTLICDEAHYLGRRTNWTKALFRMAPKIGKVYLATGTPIRNWAEELWPLLYLLHPDDRRFTSYWRWAREWFEVGPTTWSPMAVGQLRNDRDWDDFFESNLGGIYLARKREEMFDLPPLIEQEWRLPMHPEQSRVYAQLRKDFISWLDSGEEVVAWNSGARLVKLLQSAFGLQAFDENAKSSNKLAAIESILRGRANPTLVFVHFRSSARAVARLGERMKLRTRVFSGETSGPERGRIVREFQAGEIDLLVGTLDTLSEGITLTRADVAIMAERSWRPSRNQQAIRRLHRLGQDRPVSVIHLISRSTIDEHVLSVLAKKNDHAMRALGKQELRELAAA